MAKRLLLLSVAAACLAPQAAWAWGPLTHMHFAHLLLWSIPLPSPAWLEAARLHPQLVLAGSLLPDVALFSALRAKHKQRFRTLHRWDTALTLLDGAGNPRHTALALGFTSHLAVDIIAHHRFVPEYEQRWGRRFMLTHTVAEWAMDGHVARQLPFRPRTCLEGCRHEALQWLETTALPPALSRRYFLYLSRSLHALERLKLAEHCHRELLARDLQASGRLQHYLHHTQALLTQVMQAPHAGAHLQWNPDGTTSKTLHLPNAGAVD
ncbi:MAG: zinc dependent phospholipase C family protein [Pseudomonadota bacterium]|uniref:zinc dependent phospholipase C family protein n=1 Tax=Thermithiobacillus tepidarius TaxID=929 RepID=UPI0009DC11AF|nr:zinc dependent phospholipase C family protein [Thermithiobacillus tepidarius]